MRNIFFEPYPFYKYTIKAVWRQICGLDFDAITDNWRRRYLQLTLSKARGFSSLIISFAQKENDSIRAELNRCLKEKGHVAGTGNDDWMAYREKFERFRCKKFVECDTRQEIGDAILWWWPKLLESNYTK